MPELPEVETVVSDLNKKIKGYRIISFWSDWPKAIKGKSFNDFSKEIKRRKILNARRIGKNIFIDLSGGKTLYIHLKMTGHLLVKSSKLKGQSKKEYYFGDKVNQYIHHIWRLEKNKNLEFSDVRKFAKIVLDDTDKVNNLPEIKKLGVDAMSKDFTLKNFKDILSRQKHKTIGVILMNQEMIAGIGNIYRSEILYEAGISPIKKIFSLGSSTSKLHISIKKILKKAIRMRGTSDSDYRDTSGAPGKFQKTLKVYRKEGQKCKKCAIIVKKIIMKQRSVFFCPKCQK